MELKRIQKLRKYSFRNSVSMKMECSKFVRDKWATTMKRFHKKERDRKKRANMKSVEEEMVEISEQQQRIKDEQMEIRKKFEEIESECDQFKKETSLISRQTLCNQQRLCLIFKILKAREDNNFSMATKLTQSLRELMKQNMENQVADASYKAIKERK